MNELLRQILFLPPQASTVAASVDGLHYFVILITMAGAALVTLASGYFVVRYRRRKGIARPHGDAESRPPLVIEIGALAGLFAIFLLWWVIGARMFVGLRVAPEGSMDVYVTAKQWMWKFAYPQGNRSLAVLYVPARRPVKLIMTSRDVIHSFYVPDFRIKQDVLPGRYTTVWFEAKAPGTYPILCTEYCGAGHSTMRGEVVALEPADFDRWLAGDDLAAALPGPVYSPPGMGKSAAPEAPLDLVRQGERSSAEQGCLRCHTLNGEPHIGPTWAGLYGAEVPIEGGTSALVDEAYITESMMDPLAKLHRGYQGVMPSYVGRIRPAETAAIIALIKSLRYVRPPSGGSDRALEGPVYAPVPADPDAGSAAELRGARGDSPTQVGEPAPAAGEPQDGGATP